MSKTKQSIAGLAALVLAVLAWAPAASADQGFYNVSSSPQPLGVSDELVGEIAADSFATSATLQSGGTFVECDYSTFQAEITATGTPINSTPVDAKAGAGDITFGASGDLSGCRDNVFGPDAIWAENIKAADVTATADRNGTGDATAVIAATDDTVFRIYFTGGAHCDYELNDVDNIVLALDRVNSVIQELVAPKTGTTVNLDEVAGNPAFCPGPTATFAASWEVHAIDNTGGGGAAVGDLAMLPF